MKKRASTNLRHDFFSEQVINNWNNLDNKTVTSGSINIFKGTLERLRQSKDLFVGNWCYLIFWGRAVPSVRHRPVSYPVRMYLLNWSQKLWDIEFYSDAIWLWSSLLKAYRKYWCIRWWIWWIFDILTGPMFVSSVFSRAYLVLPRLCYIVASVCLSSETCG